MIENIQYTAMVFLVLSVIFMKFLDFDDIKFWIASSIVGIFFSSIVVVAITALIRIWS